MLKNVLQICALMGVWRGADSNYMDSQNVPLKWSFNVLQDKVSVNSLKEIEPGFDLTDEEIRKFKIWRNGNVPYYIDSLSFDKVLRDRIRTFLEVTSRLTGLQFLEIPDPPIDPKQRWVFFLNRRGLLECSDHSIKQFTNEGVQKVVLGYDCLTNSGELADVVLLLAGVPPQHNSPDRDQYVKINMDKILPEKRSLYEKVGNSEWLFHDLKYDFASAGHYHCHKHTVDGSATISPVVETDILIGEGEGFSYSDILKVRMLYNYIGKKPLVDSKGSECKKLFKPGARLSNYNPKQNNIEPRSKPDLYLGLTPKNEPEKEKEGDDGDHNNNGDKGADENENVNAGKKKNADDNENTDDDENFDKNKKIEENVEDRSRFSVPEKLKQAVTRGKHKKNVDVLTLMSDYDTDIERYKKKRLKDKKAKG